MQGLLIGWGRRAVLGALLLFVVSACGQSAQDEAAETELTEFRIGITGSERDSERMKSLSQVTDYLTEKLGVSVTFRQASDYSGVAQAMAAGQIEAAITGPSNFANMFELTNGGVAPLAVNVETDGSLGYYTALYVHADSEFQKLEDLEGASIAYPDANSTSGYLYPRYAMREKGIDPDTFFSKSNLVGGHQQAIIAVVRGQYDAGTTWVSGKGNPAEGYTRGELRRMVNADMLDMSQLRVIELFGEIPNGGWFISTGVPAAFKAELEKVLFSLHEDRPEFYELVAFGGGQGYASAPEGFYDDIIAIRAAEKASRRN